MKTRLGHASLPSNAVGKVSKVGLKRQERGEAERASNMGSNAND
jgi:hypothetical protein